MRMMSRSEYKIMRFSATFWSQTGSHSIFATARRTSGKIVSKTAAMQTRLALNLIRLYAVLSAPFIPDASAQILAAMNTTDASWPGDIGAALQTLPAGHAFTVPENLFRKITDEERSDWQQRFSGIRT